jgi:hypothetical protein
MSWRAQNRSKDAKTPSVARALSDKPEPDRCPVQPQVAATATYTPELQPLQLGAHTHLLYSVRLCMARTALDHKPTHFGSRVTCLILLSVYTLGIRPQSHFGSLVPFCLCFRH